MLRERVSAWILELQSWRACQRGHWLSRFHQYLQLHVCLLRLSVGGTESHEFATWFSTLRKHLVWHHTVE